MTTLIFPKTQRQCASFSINLAILFLSLKWTTTTPKKLIDNQHYQRLRRKMVIAFNSLTFHLTTTQLNLSFRTWGSLHCIWFDPLHRHHFCVARRPTRQEALPDLFESNPVQRAVAFSFWRIKWAIWVNTKTTKPWHGRCLGMRWAVACVSFLLTLL